MKIQCRNSYLIFAYLILISGCVSKHAASPNSEGLSKEQINSVINQHRAEVRKCYDEVLVSDEYLRQHSAKLVVQFNILPNGRVTKAIVKESNTKNDFLNACVLSRLQDWKFPEAPGVITTEVIAYPFHLSPKP